MTDLNDLARERNYEQRLHYERILAQAQLGVMLDDLCRDFGMDPVKAWRTNVSPSYQAWRDRLDRDISAWLAASAGAA